MTRELRDASAVLRSDGKKSDGPALESEHQRFADPSARNGKDMSSSDYPSPPSSRMIRDTECLKPY